MSRKGTIAHVSGIANIFLPHFHICVEIDRQAKAKSIFQHTEMCFKKEKEKELNTFLCLCAGINGAEKRYIIYIMTDEIFNKYKAATLEPIDYTCISYY